MRALTSLRLVAAAVLVVTVATGVGVARAVSDDPGREEPSAAIFPTNEDGLTYGPINIAPHDTTVSDEHIPDLVAVVGNKGKHGFADAREVHGKGESAPRSPKEALEQQRDSRDRDVPVYAADGKTVIDTFTIQGANDGEGVVEGPMEPK